MFTSFAHRFAALLVLLLVSNALAPALAAPASPTTVSTSIPNQYRTVLFTGWMGWQMVYRGHVGVSDEADPQGHADGYRVNR